MNDKLKIKMNFQQIKSLCKYLNDLLYTIDLADYTTNYLIADVFQYHLKQMLERLSKLMFKAFDNQTGYFNLILNKAEKIVLFQMTSLIELPLNIQFVNYETSKQIIKY